MYLSEVPSSVKYMSGVIMFYWMGRSTVWNFLPIFIENHIPSVLLLGFVTSLPPLVTLILDVPVSNFAQKADERATVLSGLLAGAVPGALYIGATPLLISAGKFFEGFSKSLTWNGAWSLGLRIPDRDLQSRSNSILLLGPNLASVAGPVLGGLVIGSLGFRPLFIFWTFLGLTGSILFYRVLGVETTEIKGTLGKLARRRTYSEDFSDLKDNFSHIRKPLSLILTYSVVRSFSWLVIPLVLERLGASFLEMGLIFAVAATPKLFQFGWGSLGDRFGEKKVLFLAALTTAPVLFWLSMVESVVLLGAGFIVSRIATNGMSPLIHSLFDESVRDEQEAEMTGFLELTKHTGQFLGPALAGTVSSLYGLSAAFLGAGAVAAVIGFLTLADF